MGLFWENSISIFLVFFGPVVTLSIQAIFRQSNTRFRKQTNRQYYQPIYLSENYWSDRLHQRRETSLQAHLTAGVLVVVVVVVGGGDGWCWCSTKTVMQSAKREREKANNFKECKHGSQLTGNGFVGGSAPFVLNIFNIQSPVSLPRSCPAVPLFYNVINGQRNY